MHTPPSFHVVCSDGWKSLPLMRYDTALGLLVDFIVGDVPAGDYWVERNDLRLTDPVTRG